VPRSTLIRRAAAIATEPFPACHGGEGAVRWTDVLSGEALSGRGLNFLHDNVLEPGVSIGVHVHEHNEEYYYILEGRGTMTLDGADHPVAAGDITAVFPGGSHGLRNDSDAPLRVLVFCVG